MKGGKYREEDKEQDRACLEADKHLDKRPEERLVELLEDKENTCPPVNKRVKVEDQENVVAKKRQYSKESDNNDDDDDDAPAPKRKRKNIIQSGQLVLFLH